MAQPSCTPEVDGDIHLAYRAGLGAMYHGDSLVADAASALVGVRGNVALLLTSPPFALIREKGFGNLRGEAYVEWLASFASVFRRLLRPDGSIVIEMGNAWEKGVPEMSTVPLRALLKFQEAGGFYLCEQFIWHNPARLPGPAAWVTVRRQRVTDAFTNLWWLSPTPWPDADNRRVLRPYSSSMRKFMAGPGRPTRRAPSGYKIDAHAFRKDNGGSIPPNVIIAPHTGGDRAYMSYCRARNLPVHPTRMPERVVEFFIALLTKPGQLVLDPFGGSNTTGAVAERMKRKWVSIERRREYVVGSQGRMCDRATVTSRN